MRQYPGGRSQVCVGASPYARRLCPGDRLVIAPQNSPEAWDGCEIAVTVKV
ncbi:hypothetical protein ASZ90_008891 [hydrocarbon metagenome]|uniref:Uncharacterized protein n=1 Tax=hydrocarbon metagenome TaxID=938273 RepID=A0A0W8FKB5_9ZZZZ